ncbi:MAG TPA: alpha/beta hydrolase [Segeticoccus sp.]|uniref:alpha/beta hydrolase n=1 Tax=Segeticoccus sp. TaxID=2706531 RepID=UPI002D8065F9|nr:alpha/beta hydrolase [Segeticoccus sp.]HET8599002.1 alpha/beta hydrolase [Segeticoccus sp.]
MRLPPSGDVAGAARKGSDPLGTTVVVVHGGFWKAAWDRQHAAAQAAAFARAGFAVAVVEYRRVGMAGGGWPGTFDDIRAALAAVRRDPELPERTVLVGHSAGGHLAVWLLHQVEGAGVVGAVSLAGCVDLTLTADLHLGDDAARALMGGPPPARLPHDRAGDSRSDERYALADPARLAPPPAPVRLVHGLLDEAVPISVSRAYRDTCERRGRQVPLTGIPGAGHFELVDPEHPAFQQVLEAVRSLAASHPTGAD